MSKTKVVSQTNDIMTEEEYKITGKEIKNYREMSSKINNEFAILEGLYKDATYELEKKSKILERYEPEYIKLKNKCLDLEQQIKSIKKEDEVRKKINLNSNEVKVDFKADREKAIKYAKERYEKEGKKEVEDYFNKMFS
jgi:hypothetical protein